MAEGKMNATSEPLDALLEARITRALEVRPSVTVPAGFAARIANQLPARPAVILTPVRYGYRAAIACLVLLAPMMLTIAHRASGSSVYWFSLQSLFCAQFALLAVWLAMRNYITANSL